MPSILERLNSVHGTTGTDTLKPTGEKSGTSPLGARRVAPFISSGSSVTLTDLKTRVQNKLLGEMDTATDVTKVEEVKKPSGPCLNRFLSKRISSYQNLKRLSYLNR